MRVGHLFAGMGGGLLADLILGHMPVFAVEWDAYCCQVLRERRDDGWFPGLHVHETDIRLFDPSIYTGKVDCLAGGFPCQDLSVAGKQGGLGEGTRSGLYREVLRIAGVVRPRFLFMENVSAILSNGLGTVLGDLAALGYDCRWLCIRASDVGAPHHRDRWFCLARYTNSDDVGQKREICRGTVADTAGVCEAASTSDVAHPNSGDAQRGSSKRPGLRSEEGCQGADHNTSRSSEEPASVADTDNAQRQGNECTERIGTQHADTGGSSWWESEPGFC